MSCAFLGCFTAKLIFNFLSLIRHGSFYDSLSLFLSFPPPPLYVDVHCAALRCAARQSLLYCSGGRAYTVLHCFAAVLYCHSKQGTFFLTPSTGLFRLPFSRPLPPPSSSHSRARPFDCANDPYVRSLERRTVTSNCWACRHSELTTEKPIT